MTETETTSGEVLEVVHLKPPQVKKEMYIVKLNDGWEKGYSKFGSPLPAHAEALGKIVVIDYKVNGDYRNLENLDVAPDQGKDTHGNKPTKTTIEEIIVDGEKIGELCKAAADRILGRKIGEKPDDTAMSLISTLFIYATKEDYFKNKRG